MASLSDVLSIAGVTRNQFNDWCGIGKREKILRTRYAATAAGVGRELSRKNALELAFAGALVRAGLPVEEAVRLANQWIAESSKPNFAPLYALNPVTGKGQQFSNASLSYIDFAASLPDREAGQDGGNWSYDPTARRRPVQLAAQINIVDRAAVVARVDGLFNTNGEG